MKITEIYVSSKRTIANPNGCGSGFESSLSYKADIEPGDDIEKCRVKLQARCERGLEEHMAVLTAATKSGRSFLDERMNKVRKMIRKKKRAKKNPIVGFSQSNQGS